MSHLTLVPEPDPDEFDEVPRWIPVKLGGFVSGEDLRVPWSFIFRHDDECPGLVEGYEIREDRIAGVPCSYCDATFTVERRWDSPSRAHGEVTP